jgi:hypothetical protein
MSRDTLLLQVIALWSVEVRECYVMPLRIPDSPSTEDDVGDGGGLPGPRAVLVLVARLTDADQPHTPVYTVF